MNFDRLNTECMPYLPEVVVTQLQPSFFPGQFYKRNQKCGCSCAIPQLLHVSQHCVPGVSNFWRLWDTLEGRRVVLGHTLNTQTQTKTKISHAVSKFTILCGAAFIAIPGRVQPAGCGVYTPASPPLHLCSGPFLHQP